MTDYIESLANETLIELSNTKSKELKIKILMCSFLKVQLSTMGKSMETVNNVFDKRRVQKCAMNF